MTKIPISPRDYYFYRKNLYTIQYAFEYDGSIDLQTFKLGLAALSAVLPIAAARLCVDSTGAVSLKLSDQAIPFRVQDFRSCAFEVQNYDASDADKLVDTVTNAENEALLKFVVTLTPESTLIGVSFSHLLGDGFSFFNTLRVLSELILKGSTSEVPFFIDRSMLTGGAYNREVNTKRLFDETGYVMPRPPQPISYIDEQIQYSNSELTPLKREAMQLNPRITNNDIVMADLLRRFHTSTPLGPNGELIVRCPVDYRRIYLQLPKNYFGNALKDAVAVFDPRAFAKLSLGEVACVIRDAIDSITPETIELELACFEDLRQNYGSEVFETIGCPGLLVSNLSKLPLQTLDFGFGTPRRMITASLNPRLAVILADADSGLVVKFRRPIYQRQDEFIYKSNVFKNSSILRFT